MDTRPEAAELLASIKESMPALKKLLEEATGEWSYEDGVYRFYHQSFKVYRLQEWTAGMVDALRAVAPGRELNAWFLEIVASGTGRVFSHDDNGRWLEATRPIVEAYMHAKYFLEMVVRYGEKLDAAPAWMDSGWASVLYLYGLR